MRRRDYKDDVGINPLPEVAGIIPVLNMDTTCCSGQTGFTDNLFEP
jgi:hypothetical protein